MKTYDITIIGFGVTGMLLLAILKKEQFQNICIIDPYFDGGDLIRLWGDVLSNIPLQKSIDALKLIDPNYTLQQDLYDPTKITPLHVVAHMVKNFTKPFLQDVDIYESTVKKLLYKDLWTITTENETIYSKSILLCQGSEPKKIKCSIPSIPLHIALNKNLLKSYLKPKDKVLLFGTSHSGVLALENLEDLKIQTTAIYKGAKPFTFATEDYDGIKEEAERIAKQILNNTYTHIQLYHINNVEKIIKASKEADWLINSIGFEARNIETYVNDSSVSLKIYDSKTGILLQCPKAYGFGIAYPSLAPDNSHVDVGLYVFVEHIKKQIPNLKTCII